MQLLRPQLAASWPGILRPWLSFVFMLAVAPVLIFLALAVPTGEVPDEVAHVLRADSVRHGEIAGFRRPRLDEQGDPATDVAVRADAGLVAAGLAFSPGTPLARKQVTQAHLDELLHLSWANRLDIISIPNTAVYPPLLYVPAAFGMQIAKWLGKGPYVAILAARMVNSIIYLLFGAAAIHLARRGRIILFGVLCLPMSLSLAASVNHDGLVIACSSLAGALLTRLDRRAWWGGACLLSVAVMAKPYLLPLALVVPATVPGGLRQQASKAAAGLAVAAAPALVWAVIMSLYVAAPFVRGPAQPAGPLWAGPPGTMFPTTNPGEQLRILLASPARLVTLPLESAWTKGGWLWHEVLGVIGTLDVTLPYNLYSIWTWVLAGGALAGLLANRTQHKDVGVLPAAAALFGSVISVWFMFMLQYLSWTRVGEALVEGVQGRYLLPVAALALPIATLPLLRVPANAALRIVLSLPVIMLALTGLAIMPLIILGAYYVR